MSGGYIKVDGVQRKIAAGWVKVDGVWRRASAIHSKVDSVWRLSHKDNFDKPNSLIYPATITRGQTITWTTEDIPGADYELQFRYNSGAWSSSFFHANNTASFNVSTNTSYNTLQFRVRAVAPTTHDKESAWYEGAVRSLTPQTLSNPINFSYPSQITRASTIRINWTNESNDIVYRVECLYTWDNGTKSTQLAYASTGSNYVDFGVQSHPNMEKAQFRIRKERTGYYDSDWVTGAEVTLSPQKLATIANISYPASAQQETTVTISWDAVANAAQYQLEVAYEKSNSWSRIYTGANRATSYTIQANRNFVQFRVRPSTNRYADGDWKYGGFASVTLPPLKTSTWAATVTDSWRPQFGGQWHSSANYVYQGQWTDSSGTWGNYSGLALFDYNSIKNTLTGKRIESVKVYFYRVNAGGYNSGQAINLHTHNYASLPAATSRPSMDHLQGPFSSFARGEGKWVTVSNDLATRFINGTAKGIGLYRSDGAGYLYMSTNVQIQVTYR